MRLTRLALVTGGHSRLGAAIAAALAADGFALALHGHAHMEPEPALSAALRDTGVAWRSFHADLAQPDAAAALMPEITAHFGGSPDLLVNNAAMFGQDRLETVTPASLMAHFSVNCMAPVMLIKAFASSACGQEDRAVINILDQRIVHPHGDQLSYTISKMALEGLTRICAQSLAPQIRVNAVAPGLTLGNDDYRPRQLARLAERMPLKRLSEPRQIAQAVIYLAHATSVTGQTIFTDSGAHMLSFDRDFAEMDREG